MHRERQAVSSKGLTIQSQINNFPRVWSSGDTNTLGRAHFKGPVLSRLNVAMRGPPLSSADVLAYQFIETFRPDLPPGKSLASFGSFIIEIPRRVGANKACDLAIRSVSLAHGSLIKGGEYSVTLSRTQYAKALVELQICLCNQEQAFSVHTLCATVLLAIYEVWRRFRS